VCILLVQPEPKLLKYKEIDGSLTTVRRGVHKLECLSIDERIWRDRLTFIASIASVNSPRCKRRFNSLHTGDARRGGVIMQPEPMAL
ncbi:hypothetical protein AAMO2058_001500000, partial [Amorphochlora amoebiformis]